ncbi:transglycosylase SLT domain-containing protein [Candidatus Woesearchaeota archaeon]|nr:transglycosylase SLT domain-containing protein [Candidatus Woesearchaeota archaeon]
MEPKRSADLPYGKLFPSYIHPPKRSSWLKKTLTGAALMGMFYGMGYLREQTLSRSHLPNPSAVIQSGQAEENVESRLERKTAEADYPIARPVTVQLPIGPLHERVQEAYDYHRRFEELTEVKLERTLKYDLLIGQAATQYNIPRNLLFAIIIRESGGNPDAVSSTGVRGIMQMQGSTAQALGDDCVPVTNPARNIECGARYLSQIFMRYRQAYPNLDNEEVWNLALAGYNKGPNGLQGAYDRLRRTGKDSFWDLQVKDIGGQAFAYVPHVRALERFVQEDVPWLRLRKFVEPVTTQVRTASASLVNKVEYLAQEF